MGTLRLDKWLWAARFYKTRSSSAAAIAGGKIRVNGARPKPSHPVRVGDTIVVRKPPFEQVVEVLELSTRRGPAAQAAALFAETSASREARKALEEALAREAAQAPKPTKGRPTKRDRRQLMRVHRRR